MVAINDYFLLAASIPLSSSTKLRIKEPINKNRNTTATPYRCEPNTSVKYPSRNGPMKAVALPENAKNPKNSFSLFLGIKRAIRLRLADWFGPENIPIKIPDNQNIDLPEITISPRYGNDRSNRSRLGENTDIIQAIIKP